MASAESIVSPERKLDEPAGAGTQEGDEIAAVANGSERGARHSQFAQSFAQIVGVLMRDPRFKKMRLADLERLVVPPLLAGQMSLAHAQTQRNGFFVPVAVALWARVSDGVDKRLSEDPKAPFRLRASEWCSGDNYWLIAVAGDPRATPMFIKQLANIEFKDKRVKIWIQDRNQQATVKTLSETLIVQ